MHRPQRATDATEEALVAAGLGNKISFTFTDLRDLPAPILAKVIVRAAGYGYNVGGWNR